MARGKGQKPVISLAEIEQKLSRGMTQADIAREVGVSRAYVSWIIKNYAGDRLKTPRQKAQENYPWKVWNEHQQAGLHRATRDHAEYMEVGDEGMTPDKLSRLSTLYKKIIDYDVVVEYDPFNFTPTPEYPLGGFRLVPREDTDGDLIIRVNEHTILTDRGRKVWRLPQSLN